MRLIESLREVERDLGIDPSALDPNSAVVAGAEGANQLKEGVEGAVRFLVCPRESEDIELLEDWPKFEEGSIERGAEVGTLLKGEVARSVERRSAVAGRRCLGFLDSCHGKCKEREVGRDGEAVSS